MGRGLVHSERRGCLFGGAWYTKKGVADFGGDRAGCMREHEVLLSCSKFQDVYTGSRLCGGVAGAGCEGGGVAG